MKKLSALFLVCALLSGCASMSNFPIATIAQANVSEANYKVVDTGVQGSSMGFSILWVPIRPSSWAEATRKLSDRAELLGSPRALFNVTQEVKTHFFILFAVTEKVVSADVIEYQK